VCSPIEFWKTDTFLPFLDFGEGIENATIIPMKKQYTPHQKAHLVMEMLNEEQTVSIYF